MPSTSVAPSLSTVASTVSNLTIAFASASAATAVKYALAVSKPVYL